MVSSIESLMVRVTLPGSPSIPNGCSSVDIGAFTFFAGSAVPWASAADDMASEAVSIAAPTRLVCMRRSFPYVFRCRLKNG
jgi:hypothetical protein